MLGPPSGLISHLSGLAAAQASFCPSLLGSLNQPYRWKLPHAAPVAERVASAVRFQRRSNRGVLQITCSLHPERVGAGRAALPLHDSKLETPRLRQGLQRLGGWLISSCSLLHHSNAAPRRAPAAASPPPRRRSRPMGKGEAQPEQPPPPPPPWLAWVMLLGLIVSIQLCIMFRQDILQASANQLASPPLAACAQQRPPLPPCRLPRPGRQHWLAASQAALAANPPRRRRRRRGRRSPRWLCCSSLAAIFHSSRYGVRFWIRRQRQLRRQMQQQQTAQPAQKQQPPAPWAAEGRRAAAAPPGAASSASIRTPPQAGATRPAACLLAQRCLTVWASSVSAGGLQCTVPAPCLRWACSELQRPALAHPRPLVCTRPACCCRGQPLHD